MTDDRTWSTNNQNLTYRFNNGVPNQLTESISPWVNNARAGWHALFAQEQWTHGRLTLQGALRFDRADQLVPRADRKGRRRFLPTAISSRETKGVDSYKDITPRVGVAYDVFGNGKTALKANLGKYLEGVGVQLNYANANPTLRLPRRCGPFGAAGRHADLDRCERQLRARLRSAEPARPGSPRRPAATSAAQISNLQLRPEHPDQQLRSGAAQRLGRPRLGLEPRRLACSSRSCRARRSKSPTAGGGITASP